MLVKLTNILSSVRFLGVVIILAIGVYTGDIEVLAAVQALLGATVVIGTVDRFGEKVGNS